MENKINVDWDLRESGLIPLSYIDESEPYETDKEKE